MWQAVQGEAAVTEGSGGNQYKAPAVDRSVAQLELRLVVEEEVE